eukprot:9044818-Alexandrium_andersonii.AAC.1
MADWRFSPGQSGGRRSVRVGGNGWGSVNAYCTAANSSFLGWSHTSASEQQTTRCRGCRRFATAVACAA